MQIFKFLEYHAILWVGLFYGGSLATMTKKILSSNLSQTVCEK